MKTPPEGLLRVENSTLDGCWGNTLTLEPRPLRGGVERLVVIIDSSPSMDGWKLYQAKRLGEALARLAGLLGVGRVDAYSFCRSARPLASGPPGEAAVGLASAKVCPGTNLAEALRLAYAQGGSAGVVVVTDARASVGPRRPESIAEHALRGSGEPRGRVVIVLVGGDADEDLAGEVAGILGAPVYRVESLGAHDVAAVALHSGLAAAVPARVLLGLPAWAELEVHGGSRGYRRSGGWAELDVLQAAVEGGRVVATVKSTLSDCGGELKIPILVSALKASRGSVVEEGLGGVFVDAKFNAIKGTGGFD